MVHFAVERVRLQDPSLVGQMIDLIVGKDDIKTLLLDVGKSRLEIRFTSNMKKAQVFNLNRVLSYTYERLV